MAFPIIPIVDVTQVSAGKVTAVTLPKGPTYRGLMSSVAGIFTLPFARRDFTLFDSEDALALGTSDLNVVSVELGLASGVTAPTLEIFAELDSRQLPFLPFLYLSSTTYDAPASLGERLANAVNMAGFSSIRATLDMSSATAIRAIMEIVKTPMRKEQR